MRLPSSCANTATKSFAAHTAACAMGAGGSTASFKGKDELMSAVKSKNIPGLNDAVTRFKPSPAVLNSLLHLAVQVSNTAVMARLVELGADPASIVEDPFTAPIGAFTGGKGTTLLHKAALYAHVEVLESSPIACTACARSCEVPLLC